MEKMVCISERSNVQTHVTLNRSHITLVQFEVDFVGLMDPQTNRKTE